MTTINETYGQTRLKEKDIFLFSNFLGFGDPENSNIWFLGNEEKLQDTETIEEKIHDITDPKKLKFYDKEGYFTKNFYDYQDKDALWNGYSIMKGLIPKKQDLDSSFISEFYFLPGSSGKEIPAIYGFSQKTRNSCYLENNEFRFLLEKRLKHLFRFLTKSSKKVVYFYSFKDKYLKEKLSILKELFDFENEQGIGNNCIKLTYNESNIIYIYKILPESLI